MSDKSSDGRGGDNVEARTLKRLLATPPDHKQSAKAKANPKKRGRPLQRPAAESK